LEKASSFYSGSWNFDNFNGNQE